MMNYEGYVDINDKVSMEEFGRFTAINDKKSKITNMVAIRKMSLSNYDYKTNLLELKSLDDEYRGYARAGDCDSDVLFQKRLAVVNKINEIEAVLRTL
ncbi:hypothetical protein [uncultured Clostridium sp.]|uniref:hypothetical protein n=1 Tax=uncultured Clostridium sp. TaxID=59620 RepID=UPI002610C3CB|nr:hypothetical protein [uncultured Clostridium sp.]